MEGNVLQVIRIHNKHSFTPASQHFLFTLKLVVIMLSEYLTPTHSTISTLLVYALAASSLSIFFVFLLSLLRPTSTHQSTQNGIPHIWSTWYFGPPQWSLSTYQFVYDSARKYGGLFRFRFRNVRSRIKSDSLLLVLMLDRVADRRLLRVRSSLAPSSIPQPPYGPSAGHEVNRMYS